MLISWTLAVFVAAMVPLTLLAVGSDSCLLQENVVQSEQEETACIRSYDNWSLAVIAGFVLIWAAVGIPILKMRTDGEDGGE
jgi:hypothetical protein